MGAIPINLSGEFVNHKTFGRGQIVEHGADFVTVNFTDTNETKKFIYPAAIQSFLALENAGTAKQYKEYSDEMALDKAVELKEAADRLVLEKKAALDHAKALKKAMKKPAKKAKAT